MSIEIWNPKELPFGPLSNNTVYLMDIDNETYNTVTNYIYSNLINSKEYFQVLKNINVQEIYNHYIKYKVEFFDNTLINALKEGMNIKLKNKKIEEILLLTENYPIIYLSDDSQLGITKTGKGKNLIGKYLMDVREELRLKYGEKEDKLYNAYVAYTLLDELIRQKENDLREFTGLNHQEIINKYIYMKALEMSKSQGIDLTSIKYNDIIERYKYVLKMPDKNILKSIDGDMLKLLETSIINPYILILYNKKKYYNNIRISQINRIKNKILDIYADYVIQTKFPELPKNKYTEAKNIEFNINAYDLNHIKDEIQNAYKEKLLPEDVLKKIDETVDMTVISEELIKNLQKMNIEYMYNSNIDNKDTKNLKIFISENVKLNENPYSALSPFAYISMLNIKGLPFPTVMHYVIACLFATLPEIKTLNNAHKYLLINKDGDINDSLNYEDCGYLFNKYEDEDSNQFISLRKKLAMKALNKKFEDIGLQELLIATGDNDIIWNDKNDIILGVGHQGRGGDNFVGTYLVELREKFKQNEDVYTNVTNTDITTIMENDLFMHSWLEMRLKDICGVVKEIQKYMLRKYNKEVIIDINFITEILKRIYEPCNNISFNITSTEPYYFKGLLNKCFGFKNVTEDMSSTLWKRIISLIYFLLKYIPKLKNIKNILAKVEIMISEKKKCIHIINNEQDNCIISAIVNIITKLRDYNIYLKNDSKVSRFDVETAINIILSKTSKPIEDKVPNFNSFIDDIDNYGQISTVGNFENDIEENEEETNRDILKAMKNWKNLKPDDDYNDEKIDENENDEFDYTDNLKDEDRDNDYTMNYNDDSDNEDGFRKYNQRRLDRPLRRPNVNIDRWKKIEKEYQIEYEAKERKKFEKYKNANKLAIYLDTHDIKSENNTILAEYIIDAVETIKHFKMSNKVKNNRINFFSTSL